MGAALTTSPRGPWLEEENWFFALSKYQERLEQLFRDNPSFCEPEQVPQRGSRVAA